METPLFLMWLANQPYYNIGGFYCKLKQLQPPAEQVVYLFTNIPFFGTRKMEYW